MTLENDRWYHRHETERCVCGHQRRDHPRQPFIIDNTPGCTGLGDYAAFCECPRFRFAVEEPPEPDALDVALASLEGLELETPDDRTARIATAGRRYWMATRPTRAQARRLGLSSVVVAEDRERFIADILRAGLE